MSIPFRKILIANRGEVALRINRTIKELGIQSAGICSEGDKKESWTQRIDEIWSLGKGPLRDTYLNAEKIIAIARQCGADAIHPGYGFLSENSLFARACIEHGLTFIGPSYEVLKLAGDKLASHNFVKELGFPVTEKITGALNELKNAVQTKDFPLMVKAVAGGGGKGIRMVTEIDKLQDALKVTSHEAAQYFGDDRVYLEKYIHKPRHIEVQIMGDLHGNIRHMFERECSVQRRHQKIIEEAPADNLTPSKRKKIIDTAVGIAKAMHFINAGTIEFLLDQSGNFYFMEINPRLQVEHGITEMITGIDIVREQIRIAAGFQISFDNRSLRSNGHAIECRIYAEDPENEFLPSPGRIHYYHPPAGKDVRLETCVNCDSFISGDFDPLIAKLMVHGSDRNKAILKMKEALSDFIINGIHHNIPLLETILNESDYCHNYIDTGYLESHENYVNENIIKLREKENDLSLYIAASLIVLFPRRSKSASPWNNNYWRSVKQIRFRKNKEIIEFDFEFTGKNKVVFYWQDFSYVAEIEKCGEYELIFSLNGERKQYYPLPNLEAKLQLTNGRFCYIIERLSYENAVYAVDREENTLPEDLITAHQPGTITEISVVEGQKVNRGDNLLIIESMKLENIILADSSGVVGKIVIKTGDKVKRNQPLIYFEQNSIN